MEAIHVSISSGKTNPMSHHVASRDKEEEEAIHLSLIMGNNLLSHVEVAAEEEIIASLSLSLSLSLMWKRSSFSCGSRRRSSNHLTYFLSLSLSLSCVEVIIFLKQSYPLCTVES